MNDYNQVSCSATLGIPPVIDVVITENKAINVNELQWTDLDCIWNVISCRGTWMTWTVVIQSLQITVITDHRHKSLDYKILKNELWKMQTDSRLNGLQHRCSVLTSCGSIWAASPARSAINANVWQSTSLIENVFHRHRLLFLLLGAGLSPPHPLEVGLLKRT